MPKCSGRLSVRTIAVASIVFVATAWLAPLTRAESVDLSREPRADVAEQRVNGCAFSLTHDKREHFLRYRNRCEQSIAEKGRRLAGLLDALFPDALPAELDSFAAGRMIQLSPELSRRLAAAAYRSDAWSAMLAARRARGAGDHGMANAVVAKLIDEGIAKSSSRFAPAV